MRSFPVRSLIVAMAGTVLIGGFCAFAFATRPSSSCGEEYGKGYHQDSQPEDDLPATPCHTVGHAPVSQTAANNPNSHQPVADNSQLPDEFPGEQPPLIGTLQSRHHTVRVHAGLRYSIADANGHTLATLISDNELANQLPGLFNDLKHALADSTLHADLSSDTFTSTRSQD